MAKQGPDSYTFEQFSKAVGDGAKARRMWHAAVKYRPDLCRISIMAAQGETLTAAQITTAATVGGQRLGLTRADYKEFVEAVNTMRTVR